MRACIRRTRRLGTPERFRSCRPRAGRSWRRVPGATDDHLLERGGGEVCDRRLDSLVRVQLGVVLRVVDDLSTRVDDAFDPEGGWWVPFVAKVPYADAMSRGFTSFEPSTVDRHVVQSGVVIPMSAATRRPPRGRPPRSICA